MGLGLQPRLARATFRLNCLAMRHLPARRQLLTLTYHRIGSRREIWPDESSVAECSTESFEAQMAWLRDYATPVDLETVLQIVEGRREAPNRPVLVTFDDGYREDLARIRPCCERLGIRPLVFLPTGFVGTSRRFWWDRVSLCLKTTRESELRVELDGEERLALGSAAERERAAGRLLGQVKRLAPDARERFLAGLERKLGLPDTAEASAPVVVGWEEARALQACFDFGAHTVTHPVLSALGTDELRGELAESRAEVERRLGRCESFAIPFGGREDHRPEVWRLAAGAGYRAVFALEDSLRPPASIDGCWMIDRLTLGGVDGAEGLAAKVTWPEVFVPKWTRIARERLSAVAERWRH